MKLRVFVEEAEAELELKDAELRACCPRVSGEIGCGDVGRFAGRWCCQASWKVAEGCGDLTLRRLAGMLMSRKPLLW